jgi:dephospho-CoA kinase
MLKVGITGGIGSGKTTVCRLFTTLGIPVYYADARGRELMNSDPVIISQVKKLFGSEVYDENGLNRKLVSDKVFQDKQLLQQLNAIVHPAVYNDTQSWFQLYQDKDYVLYEAAIIFETGSNAMLDKVILVVAPLEERISRTMLRDSVSREEVLERVNKQLPDSEKIKKADFIIHNDHSEPLTDQVLEVHRQLLQLSQLS